jgi:ASC-1-like (ASCH) protein
LGLKTVEGRLNKGDFTKMKIGDIIEWHNEDFLPRTILTEIIETVNYPTFKSYLETEGLDKCLPGMPTLDHGLSVYYKYFSKEDETNFGINAIRLKVIH